MAKVSNNHSKNNKKEEETKKSEEKEKNKEGLKIGIGKFLLGIAIGGGLYILIVWLLFISFPILHYALIAMIAAVIVILLLFAFQITTGLEATQMQAPILVSIFIIFIIVVLRGYVKDFNLDKNKPEISNNVNSFKSETLTFVGDERLVAKAYLPIGKEYRVTVNGSCVNFVKLANIEVLAQEHGTYIFRITSEGSLIFDGTGSQSIVTIEWKE